MDYSLIKYYRYPIDGSITVGPVPGPDRDDTEAVGH